MATVEAHLGSCSQCGQIATQVPDDRLVSLLRSPISGPDDHAVPLQASRFAMTST